MSIAPTPNIAPAFAPYTKLPSTVISIISSIPILAVFLRVLRKRHASAWRRKRIVNATGFSDVIISIAAMAGGITRSPYAVKRLLMWAFATLIAKTAGKNSIAVISAVMPKLFLAMPVIAMVEIKLPAAIKAHFAMALVSRPNRKLLFATLWLSSIFTSAPYYPPFGDYQVHTLIMPLGRQHLHNLEVVCQPYPHCPHPFEHSIIVSMPVSNPVAFHVKGEPRHNGCFYFFFPLPAFFPRFHYPESPFPQVAVVVNLSNLHPFCLKVGYWQQHLLAIRDGAFNQRLRPDFFSFCSIHQHNAGFRVLGQFFKRFYYSCAFLFSFLVRN